MKDKGLFLHRHTVYLLVLCCVMMLLLCGCTLFGTVGTGDYASSSKKTCEGEHTYGQWNQSIDPSCAAEGERIRVCSECGYEQKESIPKLRSHVYSNGACTICETALEPSEDLLFTNGSSGGYCLYGLGYCQDTDIVIPDTYMGEPVVEIDNDCFDGLRQVTSVSFPETLKYMGSCLNDCPGIVDAVVPKNVKLISGYAFSGCDNLQYLVVDGRNPNYASENNCILGKNSRTLVRGCNTSVLPSDVTKIDYGALSECNKLESVRLPDSVRSIGERAFAGCDSLSYVFISKGVRTIEWMAFLDCPVIETIEADEQNTTFYSSGNCLLSYSEHEVILGGKSSVIPDEAKKIGRWAFAGRTGLTEINIPYNVTYIADYAFERCKNLTRANFQRTSGWYWRGNWGREIADGFYSPSLAAKGLRDDYSDSPIYIPEQ